MPTGDLGAPHELMVEMSGKLGEAVTAESGRC